MINPLKLLKPSALIKAAKELPTRVKKTSIALFYTLGVAFMAGLFTATASGVPVFNNMTGDKPTLTVANASGEYVTSRSANVGDVLTFLVYDHQTNDTVIANNVVAKVTLPNGSNQNPMVNGRLSADNAAAVSNNVNIATTEPVKLSYIAGTAKLFKIANGQYVNVAWPSTINGDSVVTTGVNLGNQQGCWQYRNLVQIQVRVEGTTPAITTDKKVELAGGSAPFGNSATAQPNDVVNFKIYLENTGNGLGIQPFITDTLDSHLRYIPDSSYLLLKENNQDFQRHITDDLIRIQGQTMTWALNDMEARPSAAVYLLFQARLTDTSTFNTGANTIQNCARSGFVGNAIAANTNCVTVNVNIIPSVVSFTLRKEVTNVTLGASTWYDQQLASARPGDTVRYRLSLMNTGNTTANNVTLKDILPSGQTFLGNVMLYNRNNQQGIAIPGTAIIGNGYVFSTIESGTANLQTITFDARLTNDCSGQMTMVNTAIAYFGGVEKVRDTASVVFSCSNSLIMSKDVLDPADNTYKDIATAKVHEGDVISYRINVQNNGATVVRLPKLKDILPSYVTYVSGSLMIDNQPLSQVNQTQFFADGMTLTDLNPGWGKQIDFQVRVIDCPPMGNSVVTNTATVSATGVTAFSDTAKITIEVRQPNNF